MKIPQDIRDKVSIYFPKSKIKKFTTYNLFYEIEINDHLIFLNMDITLKQIIYTGHRL